MTVTPSGPNSRAHVRVSEICAPFAALYAAIPGRSDPIWTIRPPPSRRIPGSTACISKVGLFTKNTS